MNAIDPLDIDRAKIAVMMSGTRIRIYPGEGFDADSFAGEIINPTEREMLGGGHVSCLWDRSKVASLEGLAAATSETSSIVEQKA